MFKKYQDKYQISNIKYQIFIFLFFIFYFLFFISSVFASDYRADYQAEYDLRDFERTQLVKVNLNIKITNLKSDVYVSKFSISFPSSFYIFNIKSFDDYGEIISKISSENDYTKIEMEFSNPNIGKNLSNNFYLKFDQKNLFKINGLVWEVFLPVIENKENGDYKIKVILPEKNDKKISISKPKPDFISSSEIIWNNPKTKAVYAVFGDYQIYKIELVYNLKNTEVFPIFKEIALPPDTLYQKIYLQSLSEKPNEVYEDIDGNYIAKYLLKPFEIKKIIFNGFVQVFSKPREEVLNYSRKTILFQKKYLLRDQPYWSIKNFEKIDNFNNIFDIYYFVVDNLQYNYNKLKENNSRLGAENILKNPSYAVCLEFTDLFVALARNKGIMSRQINGYGFSLDPKLQPLSLSSDILHAWPEYYDENLGIWKPIDPTWEKTSGIDYFSSFDLNHIVFSIHGKSSEYPLPAGMYKINDSKDIIINSTKEIPKEIKKINIENFEFFQDKKEKKYKLKLNIKNEGNIYLFNLPLEIKSNDLEIKDKKIIIDSLLPLEKKELIFSFEKPEKINFNNNVKKIDVYIDNQKILEKEVKISFVSYQLIVVFLILLVIIFILIKKFFIKK